MLLMATLSSHAQQTDPALTAAVAAQTVTLATLFDARKRFCANFQILHRKNRTF